MRLDAYCDFHKCQRLGGSLAHPAHMDDGDPWQFQLLALVSHTSPPHGNGHPIRLMVDNGPIPEDGKREFRILCTHPGCNRGMQDLTYRIDPAFAGACAIAFHAVHEGHALELWWDGVKIHPPEEEK